MCRCALSLLLLSSLSSLLYQFMFKWVFHRHFSSTCAFIFLNGRTVNHLWHLQVSWTRLSLHAANLFSQLVYFIDFLPSLPCWWSYALWFLAEIQDRKTDSKWSRISYFIGFWLRVLGLVSKINITISKHTKDHEHTTALDMLGSLMLPWTSDYWSIASGGNVKGRIDSFGRYSLKIWI